MRANCRHNGKPATGTIYRRGNTWWCSLHQNGERIRKRGGATRDEAERTLELLRTGTTPAHYSLRQAIEDHLEDMRLRGCKPRTIESAEATLNAACRVWGASTPLRRIAAPQALKEFLAERDLANESKRKDLRVLGGLFRYAHDQGQLPEVPKLPKVKATKPAPRILTPDELERLLEAANPSLRIILTCLAFTAARAGELRQLRWRDVLPEVLLIPDTKTGVAREIPQHRRVREVLKSLPGDRDPDALVFMNSRGRPWIQTELSRSARATWERAGLRSTTTDPDELEAQRALRARGRRVLGPKPCHSLRATACSWMIERGASLVEVCAVAGWSSAAVAPHYLRASERGKRRALDLL